jgi:hypothetical protein
VLPLLYRLVHRNDPSEEVQRQAADTGSGAQGSVAA